MILLEEGAAEAGSHAREAPDRGRGALRDDVSGGACAATRVLGVSSDYPALVKLTLREGRFFDRTDEDTHNAVCAIGDRVRRCLFGFEPALGRPLKVNDQWLTVDRAPDPAHPMPTFSPKRRVPHGVTLVGRRFDEGTLGRAGIALERALGSARSGRLDSERSRLTSAP